MVEMGTPDCRVRVMAMICGRGGEDDGDGDDGVDGDHGL